MIEKIRQLTICVSPGGEGNSITWKHLKKSTLNNAQ